jgi:hypothetical protein
MHVDTQPLRWIARRDDPRLDIWTGDAITFGRSGLIYHRRRDDLSLELLVRMAQDGSLEMIPINPRSAHHAEPRPRLVLAGRWSIRQPPSPRP